MLVMEKFVNSTYTEVRCLANVFPEAISDNRSRTYSFSDSSVERSAVKEIGKEVLGVGKNVIIGSGEKLIEKCLTKALTPNLSLQS